MATFARVTALDGRPWRVGIDQPTEIPSGVQLAIDLGGGSHHLGRLPPLLLTRRPPLFAHHRSAHRFGPIARSRSVSIVAADSPDGRRLSQALMVLGPVDGVRPGETPAPAESLPTISFTPSEFGRRRISGRSDRALCESISGHVESRRARRAPGTRSYQRTLRSIAGRDPYDR